MFDLDKKYLAIRLNYLIEYMPNVIKPYFYLSRYKTIGDFLLTTDAQLLKFFDADPNLVCYGNFFKDKLRLRAVEINSYYSRLHNKSELLNFYTPNNTASFLDLFKQLLFEFLSFQKSPRDGHVLLSHYGIENPQQTAVTTLLPLVCSKERIRQIKEKTLGDLKSFLFTIGIHYRSYYLNPDFSMLLKQTTKILLTPSFFYRFKP
ncbi:MAG: hypothetical protein WCQ95_13110 [Bacteroidota bacterium]